MLSEAWQIVQLGVGVFLIAALSVELARRPFVVVLGLLGAHVFSLLYTGELESRRVMGINVDAIDVVYVIVLAAALIRMRRGPSGWQWALLGVMALTMYAALRGAIGFGGTALLGFRAELYFVIPALFVSTLPRSLHPRVVYAVVAFGAVLALVAVGRWLALATGLWSPVVPSGTYAIERVINAASSQWVAFAGVAGLVALLQSRSGARRWVIWAVTGLTLVVVLFSQHRTVWVATMTMLAIALVDTRRRWYMKAAMTIMASVAIVIIASLGPDDVGAVGESLATATANVSTWEWRLERWQDVWATHAARGATAIVVGSGYGHAWVSGAVGVWEASPHNGYLQIAVRLGIIGAALVFVPYLVVLVRLRSAGAVADRIVWLWIVGTLVYYVPYAANPVTGVALGASLVLLKPGRVLAVDAARESTGMAYGTVSGPPEPATLQRAEWRRQGW